MKLISLISNKKSLTNEEHITPRFVRLFSYALSYFKNLNSTINGVGRELKSFGINLVYTVD